MVFSNDMKKQIIIIAIFTVLLVGCAGHRTTTTELTDEQIYNRAKEYFDNGKYSKVIEMLNELRYSPSVWADDAHLLTAKAYIESGQPSLATAELKWLVNQYSQSELVEEASFLLGNAYRLASPRAELDQEYTRKAIDAYNDFLDSYPMSSFADSADAGIKLCREKLAHKQYLSAELYYKTKKDSAAIIYINDIRTKYVDTNWRLWADYLEAKIRIRQDNLERAKLLLQNILANNPDEKLRKKSQKLLSKCSD